MRPRRESKLMVEPAAVATGDIAFNLIVFFLVCASTQPSTGRKQDLPRSEQTKQADQKMNNIELTLTRTVSVVSVNGDPTPTPKLAGRMKQLFADKPKPEDRIVVIKCKPEVPYEHWIAVATTIQDLGGSITIQREEEQIVTVN